MTKRSTLVALSCFLISVSIQAQATWRVENLKIAFVDSLSYSGMTQLTAYAKKGVETILTVEGLFTNDQNVMKVDSNTIKAFSSNGDFAVTSFVNGVGGAYSIIGSAMISGSASLSVREYTLTWSKAAEESPLMLSFNRLPVQLCFAFVIPLSRKDDLQFSIDGTVIPLGNSRTPSTAPASTTQAAAVPTGSAQRLKVAVILPDVEMSDPVLETAAKTIQDTIVLNLVLSGRYSVDRIDFLTPAKDFAKARTYLEDRNYDGAIWGLLGRGTGGITIGLSAWKRGEDKPGVEETQNGATTLGIFDVADQLTQSVLERFTGTRTALGTLVFRPSGDPIPYRVSINGEFVGEGIQTLRVPAATALQIRISAFVNGQEYPQEDLQVTVAEDEEQEVAFQLEAPKVQSAPAAQAAMPVAAVPPPAPSTGLSDDERFQLLKLLDQRSYRNDQMIKEIEPLAARLPEEERKYLYDKYSLSWAILPALGNTFYGLGSWLQGDDLGGLWCTGCMVGGLIIGVASAEGTASRHHQRIDPW